MPSSILGPLAKFVRRVKKIRRIRRTRRKPLADRLSAAKRINPDPHHHHHHHRRHRDQDYTNGKHERTSRLATPAISDGAWKCCNAHDQEIIHWRGRHPFKYLSCTRCKHVLCRQCSTTSVMTSVDVDDDQMIEIAKSSEFVAFGQVCRGCGLSHRGRAVKTTIDTAAHETVPTLSFDGVVCECGRVPDDRWFRFKIGGVEEYRRDPQRAVADLSLKRVEGSVLGQMDGVDRSCAESMSSVESK